MEYLSIYHIIDNWLLCNMRTNVYIFVYTNLTGQWKTIILKKFFLHYNFIKYVHDVHFMMTYIIHAFIIRKITIYIINKMNGKIYIRVRN